MSIARKVPQFERPLINLKYSLLVLVKTDTCNIVFQLEIGDLQIVLIVCLQLGANNVPNQSRFLDFIVLRDIIFTKNYCIL